MSILSIRVRSPGAYPLPWPSSSLTLLKGTRRMRSYHSVVLLSSLWLSVSPVFGLSVEIDVQEPQVVKADGVCRLLLYVTAKHDDGTPVEMGGVDYIIEQPLYSATLEESSSTMSMGTSGNFAKSFEAGRLGIRALVTDLMTQETGTSATIYLTFSDGSWTTTCATSGASQGHWELTSPVRIEYDGTEVVPPEYPAAYFETQWSEIPHFFGASHSQEVATKNGVIPPTDIYLTLETLAGAGVYTDGNDRFNCTAWIDAHAASAVTCTYRWNPINGGPWPVPGGEQLIYSRFGLVQAGHENEGDASSALFHGPIPSANVTGTGNQSSPANGSYAFWGPQTDPTSHGQNEYVRYSNMKVTGATTAYPQQIGAFALGETWAEHYSSFGTSHTHVKQEP